MDILDQTSFNEEYSPGGTKWKEAREALLRLNDNKDWQLLIKDFYLNAKVKRCVSLLSNHVIEKQGLRNAVIEELMGISHFENFLLTVQTLGAEDTTNDNDDAVVEASKE